MLKRIVILAAGVFTAQASIRAQYSTGVQGGPLFFQGAWEAKQALSNTHGWVTGIQVVEGRSGKTGFRIGLDAGQRAYAIRAVSDDTSIREEFSSVSTILWVSFEMRFPLSRTHRIFFDLGPVIGAEVNERREGARYEEGYALGTGWYSNRTPASESESGFAIRDGHWRIGVSAELPMGGRWLITSGAHLCPGVGSWALGHGYATLDASVRAGVLYRLHSTKKT